jgi:DNA invertase Pin-like site-specific DNA recombinase
MKPKAYSYLRMSTDLQLKGDSRRRQLEASQIYAEEFNLDLASDASLEDIGISAYKGANAREGALGQFLTAVKAGSIAKGSYLIVESLDRLSREEILPAHTLFLSIVQAGINLVTLTDRRVYSGKTTNLVDMITSLVIMERAHEESKTKGLRVGAAWKQKRMRASQGQPMTARCPAWLRLAADRKIYEIIPDRVEIVRQIFADSAAGIGMYSIATRLNKKGVPAFVGKNGWHRSYVAKTLANRAVLGEFHPHVKLDGKRVPQGEPIQGYFPSIVSEELFFQAEYGRSQRFAGGKGGGRKGPGYTNLFTGLARCAHCKKNIAFENKGAGTRGGSYLICGDAQRGLGCEATRWRYKDFETSFLAFVKELDLESIINSNEDAERRKRLEGELAAISGKLSSVRQLMEKTYELLSTGGSTEFVSGKLRELTDRQADLAHRLSVKEAEQLEFNARDSRFYSSREDIKNLVEQLQNPASEETYKVRAQIAARLKVLVETLLIAPQGDMPAAKRRIQQFVELTEGKDEDVISHMEQLAAHPEQSRRYFVVGFRDATVRAVFPAYNDPLKFDQQVLATPNAGFDVLRPETEPRQPG